MQPIQHHLYWSYCLKKNVKVRSIMDESIRQYHHNLRQETLLLQQWFQKEYFCDDSITGGFEFEFWLTDATGRLIADNLDFLSQCNHPAIVAEVGCSSLEINTQAFPLQGHALSQLNNNLEELWQHCRMQAKQFKQKLFSMGIPPTSKVNTIPTYKTNLPRYTHLENTLNILRNHHPYHIHIRGKDELKLKSTGIAINGLTSSFQIHMQIPFKQAKRYYNAAQIVAAPVLALSGNAPYFCGKELWEETRIALFEQVMTVKQENLEPPIYYATFGEHYIQNSLMELFQQNYEDYPTLLPIAQQSPAHEMRHVQLQNSTIYRWNRPVIDFDKQQRPHLRIEFRALAAGPSVVDMLANAALFYGLTQYYATRTIAPESQLPFDHARRNFYQAARLGIHCELTWPNQKSNRVLDLVEQELLAQARQGLLTLKMNPEDIDYYLGIIAERVHSRTSGSQWAKQFIAYNGPNFEALTHAIMQQQQSGQAIHCWRIDSL